MYVIISVLLWCLSSWAAESLMDPQFLNTRINSNRPGNSLNPMYLDTPVDSNYIIGPGDFFDLYIEGANFSVQVSPEGSIGIERVGVISVNGLTLGQAKQNILQALTKHFAANECFVQLSQLKRFRVSVSGAVKYGGQHPVDGSLRLSAVLRSVGGIMPLADLERIQLIRNSDTLWINLMLADKEGDLSQDPIMTQGDQIHVPFIASNAPQVTIRNVDDEVMVAFQSERTVDEYLWKGGLLNKGQFPKWIRLLNEKGEVIEKGELKNMAHKTVKESWVIDLASPEGKRKVYVAGMVGHIGSVEYNPGYTPMDYIAAAGVTPYSASIELLEVVRYENAQREFIDPVKGKVYPGDMLDLPKSRYERLKDFTVFMATLLGVLSSSLIIYQAYH